MLISKKQVLNFTFLLILGLLIFSPVLKVKADNSLLDSQEGINDIKTVYGSGDDNPDVRVTIAKMINVALGFIGIIFLALTIYAGFKYMTAGGSEEETAKAIKLLRNAIFGLLIILMAWGITRYSIIIFSKTAHNAVDYNFYPQSPQF